MLEYNLAKDLSTITTIDQAHLLLVLNKCKDLLCSYGYELCISNDEALTVDLTFGKLIITKQPDGKFSSKFILPDNFTSSAQDIDGSLIIKKLNKKLGDKYLAAYKELF